MMKDETALVVFSGGQDSTTCLYWAKKHFKEVMDVSFVGGLGRNALTSHEDPRLPAGSATRYDQVIPADNTHNQCRESINRTALLPKNRLHCYLKSIQTNQSRSDANSANSLRSPFTRLI